MSPIQKLLVQKEALDWQIAEMQAAERADAIARIRSLMTEAGVTAADLVEPKATHKKLPVKYRGQPGQVWSGRGLRPKWLREALAAGAALESFVVKGK